MDTKNILRLHILMGKLSSVGNIPVTHQAFAFLLIALVIYIALTPSGGREGFEGAKNGKFESVRGNQVYDNLYASMYDPLFVRKERIVHEINSIYGRAGLEKGMHVLDVGSGTGHLCGSLAKDGISCTGMDKSAAMVQKAKENYPDVPFVQGDATMAAHNYFGKFDVISCMYFTFYEMKNKEQFLRNCFHWLKPGGLLFIHMADPEKLDPILPVGNVLISINPQNFAEKRITTTRAVFENKEYKSDLQSKGGDNYLLVETIVDRRNGNVKRLERELVMPAVEKATKLAQSIGFVAEGGAEMEDCGYVGQYIYVFRKRN